MAIVDAVENNRNGLRQQFDGAVARGRISARTPFTPVVRRVGPPADNNYVMFCINKQGRPLRVTESIEFRTTLTGSSRVPLVRRDKQRRRWVRTGKYVP